MRRTYTGRSQDPSEETRAVCINEKHLCVLHVGHLMLGLVIGSYEIRTCTRGKKTTVHVFFV